MSKTSIKLVTYKKKMRLFLTMIRGTDSNNEFIMKIHKYTNSHNIINFKNFINVN